MPTKSASPYRNLTRVSGHLSVAGLKDKFDQVIAQALSGLPSPVTHIFHFNSKKEVDRIRHLLYAYLWNFPQAKRLMKISIPNGNTHPFDLHIEVGKPAFSGPIGGKLL